MRRKAVQTAYVLAIDVDCPHCGAAAGAHCTRTADNGATIVRFMPCVARIHRMQPLDVEVVDDENDEIDFTEPRKPKGLWCE